MDGGIAGVFFVFAILFGVAFALFVLVFWIWMLIDCLKHEPSEGNDKVIWVLVIIFLGWIGALVYFFARRGERIKKLGH